MKRAELTRIIKEEIDSVLLQLENQPPAPITPDQAMNMLVKQIGELRDKYNKPLDVKIVVGMDGLHKAISKASAFYPAARLVDIAAKKMKESQKSGTTAKQAESLARELFDMARKKQEAMSKMPPKSAPPESQDGNSYGVVKNNQFVTVLDHAKASAANRSAAGRRDFQKLANLAASKLKVKKVKPINSGGKLAFVAAK